MIVKEKARQAEPNCFYSIKDLILTYTEATFEQKIE